MIRSRLLPTLMGAILLIATGISTSIASASNAIPGTRAGAATPVVLIVLDELPTVSLLRPDSRIDAKRFPQIAGFASKATWYRDNVAAGDFTAWAIPSIFTGNQADYRTLPTSEAQPDNVFNLLGPGRRVHVKEDLTELCSRRICPDGSQGGAESQKIASEFIKAKYRPVDIKSVKRWIKGMPAGDGTLSVLHLTLPHQPHRFTPEGTLYPGTGPLGFTQSGAIKGWTVPEPGVALVQQRHLLQLGYADRLVGQIMRKIRRNGDFKRAMIVVTADHGFSFDPALSRRGAVPGNVAATVNPPLIVKYPGQTVGQISTASTQSIDIVPTIAEQLGVEDRYRTAGMPLDRVPTDRVMTVSRDGAAPISVTAEEIRRQRPGILGVQVKRLGSGPLWTLGPRPDLIGRRAGKGKSLPRATVRIDDPTRLSKVKAGAAKAPALVSGVLTGVSPGQRIAITLNGRIRATTRAFQYSGATRFGAILPPRQMKKGYNRVTVRAILGNRTMLVKRLS